MKTKILLFGVFSLIAFYIWMNLNPTYTTPNIDKITIEYEDAVNDLKDKTTSVRDIAW